MTETIDDQALLSPAEVVSLQRAIEAGVLARAAYASGEHPLGASDQELVMLAELGEAARQRFIRANLRLVAMVARQMAIRSNLSQADLYQEGCVGLITAVERFDHARGYRFSTYALFWIRAYVAGSAARQLGALNLPTSRAEQLRAARGVEAELAQRFGRTPTVGERGVTITARRNLDDAGAISWHSTLTRGLTWQTEGVREAADQAMARLRREYDLG